MLAIELTINILPLGAIILGSALAGFMLRTSQIKASHKKIIELEKEMLSNHAEILELQRERAQLAKSIKQPNIPVIAMRGKEEIDLGDQKSRKVK